MNKSLPTRTLREQPDLDQLKRQAKELLEAVRTGESDAAAEVHVHYHDAEAATFALHDAQLVLARAYGFDSWPKLKAYVDGVTVTRLAEAVRAGDLEQVRAMLKVRPELARTDMAEDNEHRALHYAVLSRQPEMVRLLMQHEADPRQGIYPHRDATTALTLSTDRGYDDIVAIIREEEKKNPETLRWDHSRPPLPPDLVEASQRGDQVRMIAYLEKNPWLMQVQMHPLMTPLHTAAAALWDQVAVWLLDHGADVNARIDGGPSPLEIVGRYGSSPERTASLVQILRSRGAELTPRAAVAYGEADWLLARHAEGKLVNGLPKNQGYRGLLEIAVTHNQPEILKLLLDLGFDPDEVLPNLRYGPLEQCARTGQVAMAEMLLERGATLTSAVAVALGKGDWLRAQHAAGTLETHARREGGLLSIAVQRNRPDMLALLLDLGLDPNERERLHNLEEVVYSSGAPLRHCASTGNLVMAEMLLARGADPNQHVYAAGPSIHIAYEEQNTAMIALLEKHGAVAPASTAGILRLTEKARQMLADEAAGRLPKGSHAPGWSVAEELLFYGSDGGDPEIVRMALDRLDWPKQDPRWHGMLMRSLGDHAEPDRERHAACFRQVLDRCDPSIPGKFGRTILHDLAADWPHPPPNAAVRVLFATMALDRRPRLNVRDDLLNSTPLGWACRWGRIELVKLLLDRGADPVEADAEPWATPRAWAERMNHQAIRALLIG